MVYDQKEGFMDRTEDSLVRYTSVSSANRAVLFALDFSTSMGDVVTSVVKGYEQCRKMWAKRIPDALFIPAGFNHSMFFLTKHAVTATKLPRIREERYRELLKGGSRLIDVFETGLNLVLDRRVSAIFVMTDGWERKSKGNYYNLRKKLLPQARELGCLIKFLIYYNPKYDKQLWEFIKKSGLQESEYIVFRDKEVHDRVDQAMVGLRDEVLKIHEI